MGYLIWKSQCINKVQNRRQKGGKEREKSVNCLDGECPPKISDAHKWGFGRWLNDGEVLILGGGAWSEVPVHGAIYWKLDLLSWFFSLLSAFWLSWCDALHSRAFRPHGFYVWACWAWTDTSKMWAKVSLSFLKLLVLSILFQQWRKYMYNSLKRLS